MGNKSKWLATVAPLLSTARVPEFVTKEVCERRIPDDFIDECRRRFAGRALAVRSDARAEDHIETSNAGRFLSLLDVTVDSLESAIERVIASMPGHPGDAIIVQEMASPSMAVCVASTHRLSDGAPWYCLDIAPASGPAVTNGHTQVRRVSVPRTDVGPSGSLSAPVALDAIDRLFLSVICDIERIVDGAPVEIEAAVAPGHGGELRAHLLQVRMISAAARRTWRNGTADCRLPSLAFLQHADENAEVVGTRTVLSMMADWNPAELIGTHPRPLALSLFRTLISDGPWWDGRTSLGYSHRPDGDVALLRVLHGRPLVDVRRSANSMLPSRLSKTTSARIVDCWVDRLIRRPALHDKVEFAVFRTVRDLGHASPRERDEYALDANAWREWNGLLDALGVRLTSAGPDSALSRLCLTVERHAGAIDARQPIAGALAAAREVATLFASIARLAFIGDAQLRSAVARGAIDAGRAHAIRAAASVAAIAGASIIGTIDDEDLGHLRPGTFEITAKAEHELGARDRVAFDGVDSPAAIARRGQSPASAMSDPLSLLAPSERGALEALLAEAGYRIDLPHWLAFVTTSLRARERAKFVLNRHVSAILDGITLLAARAGVDRDTMSWLTWQHVADQSARDEVPSPTTTDEWDRAAREARKLHEWQSSLIVSPMLVDDDDRNVALSTGTLPNFIGRRVGQGRVVALTDPERGHGADLAHSIVVTERADPGYEWLFRRNIAGLITAWGGANSHLGIRCAEHALPAAIGCGEAFLARAMKASHARIDPVSGGIWLR